MAETLHRGSGGRVGGEPRGVPVATGWRPSVVDEEGCRLVPSARDEIDHHRRVRSLAAAVCEAFPSIAIVEDHALVADALVDAMVGLGLGAWVMPTTSREALLTDLAGPQGPRAVILDLTLGEEIGDATDLIPLMRRLGITVVVATGDVRRPTAARCYGAGACTVVTKGEPFHHLLEQLAVAAACERCITDNEYFELVGELRREREAQEEARARFARLTPREADVLEPMCDGCSIAETAEAEFVSETTVRSHIRAIFLKLDVRTQLAAAAAAHRTGWIEERRSRQHLIEKELADTIDQVTMSVEAGLGFEAALARVARAGSGPLSEELSRTLREIQLDIPRHEALRALADRTDVADLDTFVLAVIQSERYGLPVAQVLQVQAEEIRDKRSQRAEERALRIPVLLIFPLAFCIFPAMFIVLLGPAVIRIVRDLGPAL